MAESGLASLVLAMLTTVALACSWYEDDEEEPAIEPQLGLNCYMGEML